MTERTRALEVLLCYPLNSRVAAEAMAMRKSALIVGAGEGISAAFARALTSDGYHVALAARDATKLARLAQEIGASAIAADAAKAHSVAALFAELDRAAFGSLDVVLYNAGYRVRGPFLDLRAEDVAMSLDVTAYGAFLVAQAAAKRMVPRGTGAIFFTGASASVKGYAESAPFAMGKFALRGLTQALARELQPKGIHVAHFVIDGSVRNPARGRIEGAGDPPDRFLDPQAIAHTYMAVLKQPRSAWSLEVELRPWVEKF
jgi:NAD(P)-dependent dehydrogenase (short-subunit alcohol dehydrogenase family)